MIFYDIIHGFIDLRDWPEATLIQDLLDCPEVQRLRHMRLLNFDVPVLQELSTSRRFAHAVGTCHLMAQICSRSPISPTLRRLLIASALVHDVGILPYGHLVEAELQEIYPEFSHEALISDIIHGVYHPANVYHQILPGRSLKVASVLRKHSIDSDAVINLIKPPGTRSTAISGTIDVDNIDNVYRMATLIGFDKGKTSLGGLIAHTHLTERGDIAFDDGALDGLMMWSALRTAMYRMMIAHPACVAYNAYLRDLVKCAVDEGIISPDEWHISDRDFEERLLRHHDASSLASQLIQGCQYQLVDYVWLHEATGKANKGALDTVRNCLVGPPVKGTKYFTWFERGKVHRAINVRFLNKGMKTLGSSSSSFLVAIVDPGIANKGTVERFLKRERAEWRQAVVASICAAQPDMCWVASYPEDFSLEPVIQRTRPAQYELSFGHF